MECAVEGHERETDENADARHHERDLQRNRRLPPRVGRDLVEEHEDRPVDHCEAHQELDHVDEDEARFGEAPVPDDVAEKVGADVGLLEGSDGGADEVEPEADDEEPLLVGEQVRPEAVAKHDDKKESERHDEAGNDQEDALRRDHAVDQPVEAWRQAAGKT